MSVSRRMGRKSLKVFPFLQGDHIRPQQASTSTLQSWSYQLNVGDWQNAESATAPHMHIEAGDFVTFEELIYIRPVFMYHSL